MNRHYVIDVIKGLIAKFCAFALTIMQIYYSVVVKVGFTDLRYRSSGDRNTRKI